MAKIQRALISVSDKTGLGTLAQILARAGIEIISTGGTAKVLRQQGVSVTDLSDYTGFPEMLDGRVKTLHPKVHGGLLFLRNNPAHEKATHDHDIQPIDLVIVNLYPFEQTVAKPDTPLKVAIENIDIGGPSMLRSAAKNHEFVTVIIDPSDYPRLAEEISFSGDTTPEFRRELSAKVFARTAAYDRAIATYLEQAFVPESKTGTAAPQADTVPSAVAGTEAAPEPFPETFTLQVPRVQKLRYGENPHQHAALYGNFGDYYKQLHGKELSYNNILDLTAAAQLIAEFLEEPPTLAILKHTNPCGVGHGASLHEAWTKAFATDRLAPFGGIIAANQPLDLPCAEAISEIFSEVIIAPEFTAEALGLLQKKKNLRLIRMLKNPLIGGSAEIRSVGADSFLLQERDLKILSLDELNTVTKRPPTDAERQAMLFGWRVVKHLKSNAILYAGPDRTLGIGAGQMSRVDSSRIAVWKAGEAKLDLKGSVICSDAFFPFPDGLIAAAEAGATAAIQPGGSKRDDDVIAAADERGMAMVFTGIRHFRH